VCSYVKILWVSVSLTNSQQLGNGLGAGPVCELQYGLVPRAQKLPADAQDRVRGKSTPAICSGGIGDDETEELVCTDEGPEGGKHCGCVSAASCVHEGCAGVGWQVRAAGVAVT
jgi:hypothetical protein